MKSDFINTVYGRLSEKLSKAKLAELCVSKNGVQTGPFGSQLHKKDYVDSGTPIITVEHLVNNRISHIDTPFVSDEDKERLSKYILQEGDIVFSRVGSVDRRALVREKEDGWLFSGRCLRVRVNQDKIDPVFLSHFFDMESFKAYVRSIAVGATMPSLNTKLLSDLPIFFPDYDRQLKISEILETFDQKIHLNQQTNETLEAIAQALFKSWFVDFDPVRAKIEAKSAWQDPNRAAMAAIAGISPEQDRDRIEAALDHKLAGMSEAQRQQLRRTAELFPDELVESELGEVPKGWDYGCLGNICKVRGGYAFKSKLFKEEGSPVVKIKNINEDYTVDLKNGQFLSQEDTINKDAYELNDGDYVLAMTGATVGKTGIIVSNNKKVLLNQRVAKFESNQFNGNINWYIHSAFLATNLKDQIVNIARGSAQPNISATGIESAELIIPHKLIIEEFSKTIDPIFIKWIDNYKQNETLAILIDTLLPKLISGELELN